MASGMTDGRHPMNTPEPSGLSVPRSHVDLFDAPTVGVLTTLMPGGQPHACLVWIDYDGRCARVNTTLERRSGRNLRANPAASLLVVDADDTGRYVQIRGTAELVDHGAAEHLDSLTRKYTRHPRFYGYVYPSEQRDHETRVIVRLHARRVTTDAIHH
jgi:PPOX class probable F420-dependent enzyme